MKWTTRVDPFTGRTMKSGLNLNREENIHPDRPLLGKYRAVVLTTYATDDPARVGNTPNSRRLYEIECDVVLLRSMTQYKRVPVQQPVHGVNDATLWVPRETTRVITPEQSLNLRRVSSRGTLESFPSNLADLDGEQVIVEFIEGDFEFPIITGAMTHVQTKRLLIDGAGWSEGSAGSDRGVPHKNERYSRYRGVETRINDQGDVLIDTVGATADDEEESPAATGGQIRFRVKSSERFTVEMDGIDVLEVWRAGGQVHIDLGEGADEQLVRGNKLTTWLLAHVHPNAVGGSSPPIDPAGGVALGAGDHLSDDHKVK